MVFHGRDFDVFVLLGNPSEPDIWTWSAWPAVVEALTPLVVACRGRATVRTTQFERDGKTEILFGGIGWNEAGHQKWVHGSPRNAESSQGWRFLTAELWAPAWSTCERDGSPPDLFFEVRNEAFWDRPEGGLRFNPVVLLAVASDLGHQIVERALEATQHLSTRLAAVLVVRQRRPWGKPFGGAGLTDAIQDLISVGLFRLGSPHSRPVDETTFVETTWTRVPRIGG